MSGAGKWIKKHPAEAVGALALLGTGGAGLAGAGPLAGLLGGGATVAGVGGANVGAASLAAGGADASLGAGGLLGSMSKAEPYMKLAQMGMSLDEQPGAPPMAPQQRPMQLQPLSLPPLYLDPEEERRKWMEQQSRGMYG